MWLLNTISLELEFFMSFEGHPYAILSHTWEDGEVSFQDMPDLPKAMTKKGFSKVIETCRLAREQGLSYAWIDTCCIDKSSSAELTEAINSMFNWYKESIVCLTFLSDLPASECEVSENELRQCRWFTRGWTLQELIAPENVEFYDQGWQRRGTKKSLQQELSAITGIDLEVLQDSNLLPTIPVARRMSWASSRKTSRVEDHAYSLLGLFDVNVPLIYGEGPKAFIRLQEEIMKQNNDLSLFAWTAQDTKQEYRGCFATSASEFRRCGGLQRADDLPIEFAATNRGVRFSMPLYRSRENYTKGKNLLDLHCKYGHSGKSIALCLVPTVYGYARCSAATETSTPIPSAFLYETATQGCKTFHIRNTISKSESHLLAMQNAHRFTVRIDNRTGSWAVMKGFPKVISPTLYWDSSSYAFHTLLRKDGFRGQVQINLVLKKNEDVYSRDEKSHRMLFIELGLKEDKNVVEPSTGPRALTPWANLCSVDRNEFGRMICSDNKGVYLDGGAGGVVFCEGIRASSPLPTFCKVPTGRGWIKCSVSTNVDLKRESGIYEVVCCIA